MSFLRSTLRLARSAHTSATSQITSQVESKVHPGYKALQERIRRFGLDETVPVHLKRGALDSILYHFTVGISLVGTGWSVYSYRYYF